MKALLYEGIKDVKVKEVGDPKILNDDDIIVKVTSTAICGSDLHLIHGMVPNLPKGSILGHETMGIVEEASREVTKVTVRHGDGGVGAQLSECATGTGLLAHSFPCTMGTGVLVHSFP